MRNETVKVNLTVPEGTEVSKSTEKRAVINIYIGTGAIGTTSIQVNGDLCDIYDINDKVRDFRASLSPDDQENLIVNIRADRETPMSILNEVKKELRKSDALTIRYSALEKKE